MDFTELPPLQKLQFLIGDTFYYFNQECGDFFDQISKSMLKRVYVYILSVLNIDWNIVLLYYLNYYLYLYFKITFICIILVYNIMFYNLKDFLTVTVS